MIMLYFAVFKKATILFFARSTYECTAYLWELLDSYS